LSSGGNPLSWDAVLALATFDHVRDSPALLQSEDARSREDYLGTLRVLKSIVPEVPQDVEGAHTLAHLQLCLAHQIMYSALPMPDLTREAVRAAHRSVELARLCNDSTLSTVATILEAEAYYVGGGAERAGDLYDSAAQSVINITPLRQQELLHARILYQASRCSAGIYAAEDSPLERAAVLARSAGDHHGVASAIRYRGLELLKLGKYSDAIERLADALRLLESELRPSPSSLASCRKYFATALACDGNLNSAEKVLAAARTTAANSHFSYQLKKIDELLGDFSVQAFRRRYGPR
jgi:tetratricopeptide (TPR) repeat protein